MTNRTDQENARMTKASPHPHKTLSARVAALFVLSLLAWAGTVAAAPERASAALPIAAFDGSVTNPDGSPATQAGAHPDATTSFAFPTELDAGGAVGPVEDAKTITVNLPAGLMGNPQAVPTCAPGALATGSYSCPLSSQVGVVRLLVANSVIPNPNPDTINLPVYNLIPPPGRPAEFGFNLNGVIVRLDARVRTGDDYGVTIDINNVSQGLGLVGSTVTLWGVPAAPSHDGLRGFCMNGIDGTSICSQQSQGPDVPFLTNPTNCSTGPVTTTLTVNSWQDPGQSATASFLSHDNGTPTVPLGPDGCDRLAFDPTLSFAPVSRAAGSPSGYAVDLHVPQNDNPTGLAEAALKKAVVRLPQGVEVSPSSADGLGGCSVDQISINSAAAPSCPDTAKIGTVSIDTPLLADPLAGSIYLAQPTPSRLLKIYLVASGQGVLVKLPGTIDADPTSGQLTATFDNNPQLPFNDLHLAFDGGARAPLTTPKACGTYATHAEFTSWASSAPVANDSSFTIDQNCDQAGRFEPTLSAGLTNPIAGRATSFVLDVARPSGQQDIGSLAVTLPPGVLAQVGGVPLCPEAEAAVGACSPASQVGTTTVASGMGTSPLYVPQAGKTPTAVYLAGPYKGAPYSLSIVVPAQAGPFDLGTVVVRAALFIDPVDAHVTVVSDPIPTILKGIPLDVQKIEVAMDRPGFMVSPTDCTPTAVTADVRSAAGASAHLASRFQLADCAALPLAPKLALSLTGKGQTTDDKHPSLSASLTMPAGGANLKRVAVTLPLSIALDPDNSASDSMCTFVAGKETIPDCPASSIVGSATATTPLLDVPLSGPVYFIKNERTDAKTGRQIKTYPTLAAVLQGSGITLVLRASTNVPDNKHLVTTFDNIPDAPVSDFRLNINGGKNGILVVSGANLCAATQIAEQAAGGQNGKVADAKITMSTPCALGVVASSHTTTSLKVTVGGIGAGKVSVSGQGLAKTARTITTATTATLAPKLSKAIKNTLAHGHDVKVKVTVSFTPKGAKKAKTVHKTLTIHGTKK
jgi:hypothetical protein